LRRADLEAEPIAQFNRCSSKRRALAPADASKVLRERYKSFLTSSAQNRLMSMQ